MQDDKKSQSATEQSGLVVKPTNSSQAAKQPASEASQSTVTETGEQPDLMKQQPKADQSSEKPTLEPQKPSEDALTWTASEYIHHEKSKNWFISLAGITILAAAIIYLIFRDFIATGTVLFSGLVFGVFASREPKDMQFSVGYSEIFIGEKVYSYQDFKSYAISQEGGMPTIVLYPLKRFDTLKTIYCAPDMIDQIVEIIAEQLPVDEHQPDAIDRLMHKVRF